MNALFTRAGMTCTVFAAIATWNSSLNAAEWTQVGGNAGMNHYTSSDIAGPLTLDYSTAFYSPWVAQRGDYYYAQSIAINNGVLAVGSQTMPYTTSAQDGYGMSLTLMNFNTGQVTTTATAPSTILWDDEYGRQIDSSHYTYAMVWAADGNLYFRRGGDNNAIGTYNPAANTWTAVPTLSSSPNYPLGADGADNNGFLTTWGSQLIYRPNDVRLVGPYTAVDISSHAYANNSLGAWKQDIGTTLGTDHTNGGYGDIPKIGTTTVHGVANTPVAVTAVVPGNMETPDSNNNYAYPETVEGTNVATGEILWSQTFRNANIGQTGFYTDTADLWRNVVSNGTYVMVTGGDTASDPRVVRAINMATGATVWTYLLPTKTAAPVLAANGKSVFIIDTNQQTKLELTPDTSGNPVVDWTKSNTFSNAEYGYNLQNVGGGQDFGSDPLATSAVLTDDTMWFIDGSFLSVGTFGGNTAELVGISTLDGSIVQEIQLTSLIPAGQYMLAVQDMAAADGKLSVLVDAAFNNDPHGFTNGVAQQYLFTFDSNSPSVPEPASLALLALPAGAMLLQRRRRRLAR